MLVCCDRITMVRYSHWRDDEMRSSVNRSMGIYLH